MGALGRGCGIGDAEEKRGGASLVGMLATDPWGPICTNPHPPRPPRPTPRTPFLFMMTAETACSPATASSSVRPAPRCVGAS
jgi:hypothetical protein